ncbi:MAG: SUF system NifU family Fe-S cluster assembly protein [Acidimicrobiia bacterium]|nr:MAG: SUF system NifU family Fe-S cluster assembly protein [Acidimicrobiia bacterium]
MSLTDLYREVILDHFRTPRNKGHLDTPDRHAEGTNPLCGDEIQIDLAVSDGVVSDVRIDGQGCSISQASASMMTEAIKGKSIEEIQSLADTFNQLMTSDDTDILDPDRPGAVLGDLEALQGVREFPVRIKCATLSWHTMLDALSD